MKLLNLQLCIRLDITHGAIGPEFPELRDWLGGDNLALIWLPAKPTADDAAQLVKLIEWTQRHGNLNLVAPAALRKALMPSFREHPHWTTFLHAGVPVLCRP